MSTPASHRRRLLRVLAVIIVVGGLLLAMLWLLQRQLIYFPDRSSVPPAETVLDGGRDVTLHTDDGLELGAWFAPPRPGPGESDRGMAVLVAPGNGGNRASRAGFAEHLQRRGFAVLLLDYRGYGGNPGSPTEDGLLQDALAATDALDELGYPPERTIYFGESLGTGVVAALQAERPPAGLVLRSPFPELSAVGGHHYPWLPVRLLLRDRFPVVEHLAASDVPVSVVYGDRDSIVPTALSDQVADEAPALAERVVIAGADHNDPVMFGARVADAVARLADRIDD